MWNPPQATEQLGWAYAYDDNGTLLGEYGMGGAASSGSTQHIYLPTASGLPLPVAAIINGQHFAVHTDHLNTPRRLTRKNGQVAWQWAFSAFGETEPTTADKRFTSASTNPATGSTTAGAVTYNLRYPGQVFDKESGLHYNYYRTYDPKTGRYTQADPIGLSGGWNRYAYVNGNPLGYTDSSGHAIDIFIDFGFIGYDIYALIRDGECGLSGNLLALGLDIAGAAIPGVTGLGAASRAKAAAEAAKVAELVAAKGVPDVTVVCRGGSCTAQMFTNGKGVTTNPVTGKLDGVSTGLGDSVASASKNIPHRTVGVTTAGDIRAAGGQVINDHGNHGIVSGLTAEKAAEVFKRTVKNPNR